MDEATEKLPAFHVPCDHESATGARDDVQVDCRPGLKGARQFAGDWKRLAFRPSGAQSPSPLRAAVAFPGSKQNALFFRHTRRPGAADESIHISSFHPAIFSRIKRSVFSYIYNRAEKNGNKQKRSISLAIGKPGAVCCPRFGRCYIIPIGWSTGILFL